MQAIIGGKSYPLSFTLATMDALEQLRGEKELDLNKLVDDLKDRKLLLETLRVMIDDPGVTSEYLKKHLTVGRLISIRNQMLNTITEAMQMESEPAEAAEPAVVDVTLEELKKKESEA